MSRRFPPGSPPASRPSRPAVLRSSIVRPSIVGALSAVLPAILLLTACDGTPAPPYIPDTTPELEAAELSGSLRAPIRRPGETDEPMALRERMAHYRVPGVAIAVIDGGELRWTRGYGVVEAGTEDPVEPSTRFPIGAIQESILATLELRRRTESPTGSPTTPDAPDALVAELLAPLEMHATGPGPTGRPNAEGEQSRDAARGHDTDGTPISADGAGAGIATPPALWSTAEDLLAWVVDLQKAHAGKPGRRLPRDVVRAALEPALETTLETTAAESPSARDPGADATTAELELTTGGRGHARWFARWSDDPSEREGEATGYQGVALGFIHSGHGAVVLTNGAGGGPLIDEILAGLAVLYDWPALQPIAEPAPAPEPKAESGPADASP